MCRIGKYRRLFMAFCGDQLPVAPRGNFLCEQKVTKESFRRRGLRFPRLLKTSTLEPPKRNHCDGFPWIPSKDGKASANQRRFVPSYFSQKKQPAMTNIAPTPGGSRRGDRNPTSVVVGEGSQGEGESKHPLPVRVFGDFLHVEKVTPRSDWQFDTAKSHIKKRSIDRPNSRPRRLFIHMLPVHRRRNSLHTLEHRDKIADVYVPRLLGDL